MIRYSEIFYSIQGEGKYTGIPTVWLRLFNCNLQCNGFGQKDPTDPSTYNLPYKSFDVDSVDKIEDLPVWEFGCDSSYSWSARYKHLVHYETAEVIADKLITQIPKALNLGVWPDNIHLCFTGGETLLPINQKAIVDILSILVKRGYLPNNITFETNGTQKITSDLSKFLHWNCNPLFSVSPKLFTVSGEKNTKAIKPEVVRQYMGYGDVQLKFVLGLEDRQWEELENVIELFNNELNMHAYENDGYEYIEYYPDYPIYIMPVGATKDEQENIAGQVATKALQKGYNVSARVHCYLWGNVIGV